MSRNEGKGKCIVRSTLTYIRYLPLPHGYLVLQDGDIERLIGRTVCFLWLSAYQPLSLSVQGPGHRVESGANVWSGMFSYFEALWPLLAHCVLKIRVSSQIHIFHLITRVQLEWDQLKLIRTEFQFSARRQELYDQASLREKSIDRKFLAAHWI